MTLVKLTSDCLLKVITNISLCHRTTFWEWNVRCVSTIIRRIVHCKVNHTNLWSVAVADNNVISLLYEVYDSSCCILNKKELLFRRIAKGVTAQGNYKSLSHLYYLSVAYITALIVCILFSASSKQRLCGP